MTLTIITPPSATNLTDLTSVKAELDISDNGSDNYLSSLIASASAAICTYLSRGALGVATYNEVFRSAPCTGYGAAGRERLLLARFPVVAVSAITEDGTSLALLDFDYDADTGSVFRLAGDRVVPWFGRTIIVQYSAGWSLPGATVVTLPSDIQRACVILVRDAYGARGRDAAIRSQKIDGLGETSYGTGITGDTMSAQAECLLAPYRQTGF